MTQIEPIVIEAKAYLDVRNGQLVQPAVLIIEKGVIKEINPESIPESSRRILLKDKVLLPGLIDTHVHLDVDFVENHASFLVTENSCKRALRGVKNARTNLLAGFTTIRNIGQIHPALELIDVALSEASTENWIEAPRIVPSGHLIGITGGHADISMFGGFAEGVMDLGIEYGIADGPEEMLKATRYQIKHGAKSIKFMATGGVTSLEKYVGAQQPSFKEMKVIVDEAKRHGLPVAAHAHGTEGIISAIKAGVTSIEHGTFLNDEAIALMKENNVVLSPTMSVLREVDIEKLNPISAQKMREAMVAAKESHQKAAEAGVTFVCGTDAGIIPHGTNIKEFKEMVDVGLTPLQSLQAGTINAAKSLGLEDRAELKEGFFCRYHCY